MIRYFGYLLLSLMSHSLVFLLFYRLPHRPTQNSNAIYKLEVTSAPISNDEPKSRPAPIKEKSKRSLPKQDPNPHTEEYKPLDGSQTLVTDFQQAIPIENFHSEFFQLDGLKEAFSADLRVLVSVRGEVKKIEWISTPPASWDIESQIIDKTQLLIFTPARKGGHPVESWVKLHFVFHSQFGP